MDEPGGPGAENRNPDPTREKVNRLLERVREGDRAAFDELFPLVYERLRDLAHRRRSGWKDNETLNTTALVHEAYLKLAKQDELEWRNRSQFLAVASKAMRHILIDHARGLRTAKRGGGRAPLPLDEMRHALRSPEGMKEERAEALVALDTSLGRLESHNRRQSRIVECRVFGGMTIKDTAEALGISPATVKRGWSMAVAWLYCDMKEAR